jgi:hypothetical protein
VGGKISKFRRKFTALFSLLRLYKRRLIRTCPVFQKATRNALGKLLAFCFLIKTSIILQCPLQFLEIPTNKNRPNYRILSSIYFT